MLLPGLSAELENEVDDEFEDFEEEEQAQGLGIGGHQKKHSKVTP